MERFLWFPHLRRKRISSRYSSLRCCVILAGSPLSILVLAAFAAVFVWRFPQSREGWASWEHGRTLQILVVVAAALVSWRSMTYDYNYFFGQWHGVDRLGVVLLLLAVAWRPLFVLPFLVVLTPLAWQFGTPLGGFSLLPDLQFVHLLALFVAFHAASVTLRSRRAAPFLFLALVSVAIGYWPSGLEKLSMSWVFEDRIEFLLSGSYAGGWLAFLSPDQIGSAARLLATVTPPARVVTLVIECGILFLLFRRKLAVALLILLSAFHVIVFLISGICFWAWVVLNLTLLILIWKSSAFADQRVFTPANGVVAAVLIATSTFWVNSGNLAWFDARANYSYRFEGTGDSGKVYRLPPRFFAPYDYPFTLASFGYLSNEKMLPIVFSATSRDVARHFEDAQTSDAILRIEAEHGVNEFDAARRDRMVTFIRRFVGAMNVHPERKKRFRPIQAPRLLWTSGGPETYDYSEPIRRVEATQVLSFFDDEQYHEIRHRPILSVEIGTGR